MDQKVITKSPRPNNGALKSYRKGVNDDYRGQRKRNLNDFGCLFIVSHEFFFSSSGNLELPASSAHEVRHQSSDCFEYPKNPNCNEGTQENVCQIIILGLVNP